MSNTLRPSERLLSAANQNNVLEIQSALADGADVNFRRTRNTPILLTLGKGYREASKALCDAGADINLDNGFGWLPLHEVAQRGWIDWVRDILANPMNTIDRKDSGGSTPMAVALSAGHEEIVVEFLNSKCDVNAQNDQGVSPLMLAIERQSLSLVERMMASRGDPSLKDKAGRSGLDRAENWPEGRALLGSAVQVEEQSSPALAESAASHGQEEVSQTGVAGIQKRRRPAASP